MRYNSTNALSTGNGPRRPSNAMVTIGEPRGTSGVRNGRGVSWAIRLLTISEIVLVSVAVAVEPEIIQKDSPNDQVTIVPAEQVEAREVATDKPYVIPPARQIVKEPTSSESDARRDRQDPAFRSGRSTT